MSSNCTLCLSGIDFVQKYNNTVTDLGTIKRKQKSQSLTHPCSNIFLLTSIYKRYQKKGKCGCILVSGHELQFESSENTKIHTFSIQILVSFQFFYGVKQSPEDGCSTAQRMKFSIKDAFRKYDQIHSFLRIWSHLMKKSLMENFIFCALLFLSRLGPRWCHEQ